jgi:MoaA/NifB/PqqE/SkfB family radical SAM enzyme
MVKLDYFKEFEENLAFHLSEISGCPFAKPRWVYISLSHRCNYNCKMCGVVKILKGYELTKEKVCQSFDEISLWDNYLTVVLTGGEPFLRKDIFEIINYGVDKNIKIEVVSNGSLIDSEFADKIIRSKLSNIAISLDGAKEETHDAIRQKGAYKKTLAAIENLVTAKKKNGYGPQISVWTTIMKENVKELFDIISLVRDLGVECLVYHPVIVFQDDMQNTSSEAKFWLGEEDSDILRLEIDKIVGYQKKNGLVAFLHDPYLWVKHFKGTLTKKEWKCNPFVFLNIGPDGEVRSCGTPFGSIQKMSLDECLKSKEAFQARSIMKQCLKPCLQTCWANPDADSLNQIINSFILNIRKNDLGKADKRELLMKALSKLADYENLLKIETN